MEQEGERRRAGSQAGEQGKERGTGRPPRPGGAGAGGGDPRGLRGAWGGGGDGDGEGSRALLAAPAEGLSFLSISLGLSRALPFIPPVENLFLIFFYFFLLRPAGLFPTVVPGPKKKKKTIK